MFIVHCIELCQQKINKTNYCNILKYLFTVASLKILFRYHNERQLDLIGRPKKSQYNAQNNP